MNRREFVISTSGVVVALVTPFEIAGRQKTIEPDLGALADGKGLNASNRPSVVSPTASEKVFV